MSYNNKIIEAYNKWQKDFIQVKHIRTQLVTVVRLDNGEQTVIVI
jgi:hypothetical protein